MLLVRWFVERGDCHKIEAGHRDAGCARPHCRCRTSRSAPGGRWPSRLVATAAVDRVSTTIWSGGSAAGLYLGTGLILALLVHTYYPGALGLREWIRVVLSWPLIFFLRSK